MKTAHGLAALCLAACLMAPGAAPQSRDTYTLDDLRRVEAARDAALKRLRDLETSQTRTERDAARIDADLIAAAVDSRRREEAADAAEQRLARLEQDAALARARLLDNETSLSDVLAALMSFGSRRPPALAASPDRTNDAVRAAILMSEAAPALSARADSIRERIVALNTAMEGIRREQAILREQDAALAARRMEIEALAMERQMARGALAAETAALKRETERLAGEAETLRDLLDGLAQAAPSSPGRKPQPAAALRPGLAPGAPVTPAVGRTVARFGQTVNGVRQSGMTLATRVGAQVVSPLDARVEFAGPFRSYGQMLILDMGDDILVIVSGLDALYAEAGQWVLTGEPIGRMATQPPDTPELYFEVRRRGQAIDPARWLGQGA